MFNSQQQPIAIYAHLALPQWPADNFDIFQYFGFGHNTPVLGMASAVREGVVRPSSCDVRSPDWLTRNTFYSRGVLFNDDSSFSRKHVLKKFGTSQEIWRPQYCSAYLYCLVVLLHVKHTFGPHRVEFMQINCWAIFFDVVHGSDSRWAFRSHLSTIHGVATFPFRRFLPDVTIHAMIKKMSVLPLTQEPLRTILPRQQRQLWLGTRLHLRLQHVWNLQSSPLFNKLIPGDQVFAIRH